MVRQSWEKLENKLEKVGETWTKTWKKLGENLEKTWEKLGKSLEKTGRNYYFGPTWGKLGKHLEKIGKKREDRFGKNLKELERNLGRGILKKTWKRLGLGKNLENGY